MSVTVQVCVYTYVCAFVIVAVNVDVCAYFYPPPQGRAWLYMALNEQALESYVRMFLENQLVAQEFYLR